MGAEKVARDRKITSVPTLPLPACRDGKLLLAELTNGLLG